MKLLLFIKSLFTFTTQTIINIVRFILVGIVTTFVVAYVVDDFTRPAFGTMNLVIIVSAFAFFGTFVPFFVEFLLHEARKEKKERKQAKESVKYQKE